MREGGRGRGRGGREGERKIHGERMRWRKRGRETEGRDIET